MVMAGTKAGKEKIGFTAPPTDEEIKQAYMTWLGREPRTDEIAGWKNTDKSIFIDRFKAGAADEIRSRLSTLGTNLMSGNIPGYDEALQKQAVEQDYQTAREQVRGQLEEAAAGGGFETSGYYSSIAKGETALSKAKITTLADMNKALAEYKVNMTLTGANLLSGLAKGDLDIQRYNEELARYNKEMEDYRAALKKSQDEWWKPVVGTLVGSLAGGFGAAAGYSLGKSAMSSPGEAPTKPAMPDYTIPKATSLGYYPSIGNVDYFSKAYGSKEVGGKF